LTRMHLIGPASTIAVLMPSLPASVELLHLTYTHDRGTRGDFSLVFADELLQSTCGVRTVLYDLSPDADVSTSAASLLELRRLTQQCTDRLEKIVWNVPFDLRFGGGWDKMADYSCTKLESLCITGSLTSLLPALARFPSLARLSLRVGYEFRPEADEPQRVTWPASTKKLQQLSIEPKAQDPIWLEWLLARLADGEFPLLHTLDVHTLSIRSGPISIASLFQRMPQLTDLRMPKIALEESDAIAAFKLVPHLRSLRNLVWPFSSSSDLAAVFPSLTELVASSGAGALSLESLAQEEKALRTIPQLTQLSWCKLPTIHPRDIAAQCARIEAVEQLRARRESMEQDLRRAETKEKLRARAEAWHREVQKEEEEERAEREVNNCTGARPTEIAPQGAGQTLEDSLHNFIPTGVHVEDAKSASHAFGIAPPSPNDSMTTDAKQPFGVQPPTVSSSSSASSTAVPFSFASPSSPAPTAAFASPLASTPTIASPTSTNPFAFSPSSPFSAAPPPAAAPLSVPVASFTFGSPASSSERESAASSDSSMPLSPAADVVHPFAITSNSGVDTTSRSSSVVRSWLQSEVAERIEATVQAMSDERGPQRAKQEIAFWLSLRQ
jgi:hypothetical protein